MSATRRTDRLTGPRPFTGAGLDRLDTERRDAQYIERLLADPASRTVLAGADGVLVNAGGQDTGPVELVRAPLSDRTRTEPILLGLDADGHAVFATELDGLSARPPTGTEIGLREAAARMEHAEAGLAAYLTALLGWHRRHRFCANCGALTDIAEAGGSRRCSRCGASHFPRTDPVVIMTVTHDEHLLLGRRAGGPPGRMSVLAGFVGPGEAAEEAVVREVREESGIEAFDPVFVASQPWPFPASLMLGFDALAHGGEPRARDGELAEVRWVALEEVRAAARDEHPGLQLPPALSIARFLIERWVAARDPTPPA